MKEAHKIHVKETSATPKCYLFQWITRVQYSPGIIDALRRKTLSKFAPAASWYDEEGRSPWRVFDSYKSFS